MKLLENMEELGGSVGEALKAMILELFGTELDDEQIDMMVKDLSLSDLLALDQAYTAGDRDEVESIIGPSIQLEYSMGGRGDINSAARTRPAPARSGGAAAGKKPGSSTSTQVNRDYSGGVQSGVTTKNIDSEDDEEIQTTGMDDEEIEEAVIHEGKERVQKRLMHEFKKRGIPFKMDKLAMDTIYELPNNTKIINDGVGLSVVANGEEIAYFDTPKLNYRKAVDTAEEYAYEAIEESKGKRCGKCGENTIVHTKKGWYCSKCDDKMKKNMEESGLDYNPARGGYNSDNDDIELNSDEVIRTLLQVADDEELASLERLANRITQSYPDSVTIMQIMDILNEPQMRGVRKDDVEYALQSAGFIDFLESAVSEEYCSYCKGGTDENVQHCPECSGTGEVNEAENKSAVMETLTILRRRAGLE